MKSAHQSFLTRSRLGILVLLIIAAGLLTLRPARPVRGMAATSTNGAAAIEQLKKDGSYSSLATAVESARYYVQPGSNRLWQAPNPAQQFNATFNSAGVRIAEAGAAKPQWQFGMKLTGYGYGDDLAQVSEGEVSTQGERIEIKKSQISNPKAEITEWYVNKPEGLEQGFTLQASPPATVSSSGRVRIALQLTGGLRAEAESDQAITLKDKQGRAVLGYSHLAAWDANHNALPATMKANGNEITLEVDDTDAVYPVTIDPLFAQQQKLTAADGGGFDSFGRAIVISGDTAIIGTTGTSFSVNRAAYIFTRSGGNWTFQAKLTAADGTSGDGFGFAVALDGNTAAVGAYYAQDGNGGIGPGAVYVYVRNGVNWSLQQKIFAGDPLSNSQFGIAVALDGNTLLAGAPGAQVNGVSRGAVYAFTRSGTTWTQQQKLATTDGAAGDQFGSTVALSGNTALMGIWRGKVDNMSFRGAAYVFVRVGTIWSQQAKLTAIDGEANDYFGQSVALHGDTALIGADGDDIGANNGQGSAYVFTRNGANWFHQQKLTASDGTLEHFFGNAVALGGNTAVVGAYGYDPASPNQGAAYVFVRNGATWTEQKALHALDKDGQNHFGRALAVSGNTVLVGAPSDTVGGNPNQGSVYSFEVANTLGQSQKLFDAAGPALSFFGSSLALHNNTLVVGTPFDTIGGIGRGSAYVYVRNGVTWSLQQKLTAADGAAGDRFGHSVAIYGDTVLVGAYLKANGGASFQGAAYVFTRSGATWTQQQKLLASDGAASDRFGYSVAMHEDKALIGAYGDTVGANSSQGSAYVFEYNGSTWNQDQKLTANDGTASDQFGWAVALVGNAAVIGAPNDTPNGISNRGSAYVFTNPFGTQWSQAQKLTAADGGVDHYFGYSVAMDNYTALIGAYGNGGGAAYVYARQSGTWNLQQQLFGGDAVAGDRFGWDVALFGDQALVGAPSSNAVLPGSAYFFERQGTVWSQRQKLTASDGAATDRLGWSVAIAGTDMLSGAPYNNIGQSDQGAVYFFRAATCPVISLTPATLPSGAFNTSYTQQLAASGGAGPYQFEVSTGVLPRGLSLSSGGLLLGTPTQAGTFNFTVTARMSNLCAGSRSYTLTITHDCPTLTINPSPIPAATINQPYSQMLTVANGNPPYQFTLFGTLPSGLTLNPLTGLISGTPTVAGLFLFQVAVDDFNGCEGLRAFMLNVNCPTITVNPATLPAATVGQGGYNQPLSAQGGLAPYTFSLNAGDSLPPGLSLVNGAIVGGPQQGGTFNFTIKATDAQGCVGMRQYSFTANCQTSTVFPAILPVLTVGAPFNQGLSASGSDGPYTYSLAGGALPSGITLSNNGLLSGTPTTSGNGNFTVNAADVYGCLTPKQYSFSVGCPTITLSPMSLPNGTTGVAYNQILTASGGSAPYNFSSSDFAVPGLTLNANGTLSGTPAQAGQFNFTITAASSGCSGNQSYTLTITQGCDTLTVNPSNLPGGTLGVAYNQQLTATGGAGSINYDVSAGSLPGGVTLGAAGELTGTPTQTGAFSFTVTATDDNDCTGQKNYSITVACPTISVLPAPPNGSVGTPFNHAFNATGNAGPYSYSLTAGALPTGLALTQAGVLTGTPTANGNFNFTVRAGSANGCTGETSHTINIVTCQAINIAQPSLPLATVGTVYAVQLNANGGAGSYNWSLTAGSLPNGLTFTGAGFFTGTPTQAGNFPISVRATDAVGCTGDANYVLVVNAAGCPAITVAPQTLPNGFNGMAYSQQLSASGGSGTYSFALTAGSLPSGLTLSPTGLLSGTLAAVGTGSFRVTATDANQCVGQREYQLTVINCSTITVNPATLPGGTTSASYNQTLTADFGLPPYSFAVTGGALPAGLTLSQAGVLSGTPAASGNFNFTVTATAANGCTGQRTYPLVINAGCPTITVNPATLPNAQAGASYSQQLTASGGNAPYTITLNAGSSLPNGLTLTGAGLLSGTPTVFGNFNFTVKATDNSGCMGMRAYSLTITAPCAAITVNPATLPNGTVGTAYNQTATATGGTAPYTYSVSAGSLPTGLSLATSGALTGTPNAAGVFNFTVKARDANGCMGTRAYTVTINSGVVNNGLQFYPLPKPLRLLDTRAGFTGCDAPGAQIPGNTSRTQLARRSCDGITIPAGAMAVTGNITTVQSGGGYLTLYPSDAAQPLVANSNYAANEIINNVFTVGLGNADGSFKIFVTSDTHVVVDVTGYYAPPAAGGLYFHPLPKPIRLLETRAGFNGAFTPGVKLAANADTPQPSHVTYDGVTIPATALAIVGNATTVNGGAGYMTLYPGGVPRPLAASSNFEAGQVMNAPFTVGLSASGEFMIFTTASTDIVIDVLGYYSTDATDANGAGLLFNPLPAPVRLLETRTGFTGCYTPNVALLTGSIRQQQARGACGGQTIAANALAIVGNATVINNQAGYLTFWPNGAAQPLVASSNFSAGQILNRHFTVGLGATGMYNIFASAQTDLIVDVSGFFAP